MSEISTLSLQYERLKSASDNLNRSVVLFKKERLLGQKGASKTYPRLSVTQKELHDAKVYWLRFIKNINASFKEESTNTDDFIPASLLEEYKLRIKSNDPYLVPQLEAIIGILEREEPMKDGHFIVLDNLLTALDVERTAVFRKLRIGRP
jgi:hypothetical protein